MNRHQAILLCIVISLTVSSCINVKSTYQEEYTSKLKHKPNQQIVMSSDDASIFLIGNSSSSTRISKINSSNGSTEWIAGVHKLGKMERIARNIIVLEDQDIALVFGAHTSHNTTSSNFRMSAVDLKSKKELWNRFEKSGTYSFGGMFLPQNNSFMIQTPEGLQAFDVSTGKIIWDFKGLSTRVNLGRLSLMLKEAGNVNFTYLEQLDRIMLEVKGRVTLLNPYTGAFEWQIEEEIGNYLNADIFQNAGIAVFYGRDLAQNNREAAGAINSRGTTLSTVASRIESGSSRGVQSRPIIMLDLATGRIIWKNNFFTNGQKQLLLTEDKLLLTGVVSYAFDRKTGDKTWQNVSDDRLLREGLLGIFAEFSGIDLTSDRQTIKEAVVIDNSVFVIFPELLEQGGNRTHISIRLYDFVTGEMLWKTTPERMEVRDMYFRSGILFLIVNGKFGRGNKMLAIDPYSGKTLYEIDARETFGKNLIYTDESIFALSLSGNLETYNIRTGGVIQRDRLGKFVIDLQDLGSKLMVVYSSKKGAIIAYHDRNTFQLLDQMEVPFYSRNMFTVQGKLFMVKEDPQFKGIMQLDLDKMEVKGFATISTSATKKSGTDNRNAILDPYRFVLPKDPSHLYLVKKNKLIKFTL